MRRALKSGSPTTMRAPAARWLTAPKALSISLSLSPLRPGCGHSIARGYVREVPRGRSKKAPAIRSRHQRLEAAWGGTVRPSALGQRRPARTRHRAICDDRYHANLVRTAPVLRADMILGKDECG